MKKQEYFNVLRVSREDIIMAFEGLEYPPLAQSINALSDAHMRQVAHKLENALMMGADYWQALREIYTEMFDAKFSNC